MEKIVKEMNSGKVLLETRNLVVRFGGLVALNGVNLRVGKGELRAIIGPNGAGKTTLFNAITGMVKPTEGRVLFESRDITSLPPHKICRRGLSRSFQLTSVFPELSVFENVWLGLNARQKAPWNPLLRAGQRATDSKQVTTLCELVGLDSKMEDSAGNLSHGDQKLLELAIAQSLEPHMLLLDEPTQGVSPHEIGVISQVIKNIAKTQTVLLIDHNMSTVRELADIITVLHLGEIIFEGTSEEVVQNKRVQEVYLGHAPRVRQTREDR